MQLLILVPISSLFLTKLMLLAYMYVHLGIIEGTFRIFCEFRVKILENYSGAKSGITCRIITSLYTEFPFYEKEDFTCFKFKLVLHTV